ncbi:MAG: PQQ-binding-like beta-propeller repeat protein [Planctomycetota bacterium]|jgi:outer membrane protein assembly factor BamB
MNAPHIIHRACHPWLLLIVAGLALPQAVRADGAWPQWGGPNRTFTVEVENLARKWPKEGPPTLWQRDIGDGYSAVVSDGERLFTMYSIREKESEKKFAMDGKEVIIAMDARTGETVWEHAYDDKWDKDMAMEFGPGPHSTPLLHNGRVYTIGCTADMRCLSSEDGRVIWQKNLAEEYGASHLGRGYGASPLLFGDSIILPIGGPGQSVMAFHAGTGDLLWKNQDFGPTFASPVIIELEGQKQLISFTGSEVSGLNPANGEMIWTHEHKTQFGANISTPVWCRDNVLFISSAYGMGARGLQLTRKGDQTTVEELWHNPKMKIHHANAVTLGDYVYGSSGDFGPAFFAAINGKTGKIAWKKRGFSKSNCILVGKYVILLDEDGQLGLAKVSPKKMSYKSRCEILDRNSWTVPTLVDSTLYIRDRKSLMALDLSRSKKQDTASP